MVGTVFKTVRKTLDISQQQVGDLLFSDKSRLSKFENGKLGTKNTDLILKFSDIYAQISMQRSIETNTNYNERIKESLLKLIHSQYIPEYIQKYDVTSSKALYMFITKFCDYILNPESDLMISSENYSTTSFLASSDALSLKRNLAISFGFRCSDENFTDHNFYFDFIRRFDMYNKDGDYVTFRWLEARNVSKEPARFIFHRTYAEFDLNSADLNLKVGIIDENNNIVLVENIEYIKKPLSMEGESENFCLWGFVIHLPDSVKSGDYIRLFLSWNWKCELRFIEGSNLELSMSMLPYKHGVKNIEYGFIDPLFNGITNISRFCGNTEIKINQEYKKSTFQAMGLYNRCVPDELRHEEIYYWSLKNINETTGYVTTWQRSKRIENEEDDSLLVSAITKGDIVMVKDIIKAGKNLKNSRALIYAVRFGRHEAVQLLLAKNVDVNIKDVYGRTALSWALELDERQIAIDLISAGAKAQEGKGQLWWGH